MTNSFSFTRLWMLIKKQWFDNAKLYLLTTLALLGLMILVFIIFYIGSRPVYDEEATYVIFFVGLYLTGFVFASGIFSALGDRPKGIYWMSVPATHLEKLVCAIIYATVIFTVIYCVCFYSVQRVSFALFETNPKFRVIYLKEWDFPMKIAAYAFFPLQALYLLGSVYFERFSFIKTTLAGLIIILLFAFYAGHLTKWIMPENASFFSVTSVRLYNEGQPDKIYQLSPFISDSIDFLFKYLWLPVLWTASYFRLKEKEI